MYPTAIRMAPSRLGRVPSLKLSVRMSAKSCTVKVDDTLYTPINNDSAPQPVKDLEEVVGENASSTSSAAPVPAEASTISEVSFIPSSLGPSTIFICLVTYLPLTSEQETVTVPSARTTQQPKETKGSASRTSKPSNKVRSGDLLTSRGQSQLRSQPAIRASIFRTQSEPTIDHKPIPIPASLAIDTSIIVKLPLDEKLRLQLLCEQASVHQIDKLNRQLRIVHALLDARLKNHQDISVPQQSHDTLPLPVLQSYAASIFFELLKTNSMDIQLSLAKQLMEPIVKPTITDNFPSRILHFSDTMCTVTYSIPLDIYSRQMNTPYWYAKQLASSSAEYRRLAKIVEQRRNHIQEIEKRFSTSDRLVIRGEIQKLGRSRNDQRAAVYEVYNAAIRESGKLVFLAMDNDEERLSRELEELKVLMALVELLRKA